MSSPPPHALRPEKTMSSRLMTMKFMQRAAASTPASSPQTPEVPSSKRQKLSSTSSSTFTPLSELEVIQRALKVEEDKRLGAVDKLAAEAGETKWVLSVADRVKEGKGLLVLNTGYSEIDCGNMNDVGRRSFGMFNRELEDSQRDTANRSPLYRQQASASDMDEIFDDSNSDDPAGINELIRESKKELTQHFGVETEAEKIAEGVVAGTSVKKRKIKEIKLNSLTSISGGKPGGKGSGRANEGYSDIICFHCGQRGHRKAKCAQFPSSKRKNVFDDGGFNRKPKVEKFL